MTRPSKLEMIMAMAKAAAARSACQRSPNGVGAIITDLEFTNVLAIGYNGPPRRLKNECPGGPVEGACGCIHAEVNALIKSPWHVREQIMVVTKAPCLSCARLILNSRVIRVVYDEEYRLPTGTALLDSCGVPCQSLDSLRP